MKNYKDQTPKKNCTNCDHVFLKYDMEGSTELYCDYNSDRPPNGGMFKDDGEFPIAIKTDSEGKVDHEDYMEKMGIHLDIWDRWEEKHGVSYNGICDGWKKHSCENCG